MAPGTYHLSLVTCLLWSLYSCITLALFSSLLVDVEPSSRMSYTCGYPLFVFYFCLGSGLRGLNCYFFLKLVVGIRRHLRCYLVVMFTWFALACVICHFSFVLVDVVRSSVKGDHQLGLQPADLQSSHVRNQALLTKANACDCEVVVFIYMKLL